MLKSGERIVRHSLCLKLLLLQDFSSKGGMSMPAQVKVYTQTQSNRPLICLLPVLK
jgi:hypothetical protein